MIFKCFFFYYKQKVKNKKSNKYNIDMNIYVVLGNTPASTSRTNHRVR